jgi:glycosyltransferase involved in cell wall biosynthesis
MSTLTSEEIEKKISDSYEIPNKVKELMLEPVVSVRTSTYNHGPYIKECIEGVLMQKTTFPVEYIIGEDYSTDETRAIVFEYAKKYPDRIRVITADYNVGAKANGRRCVRACRGKYIALCEGDDYWIDPYKLQKQVDFLEKNPEYGMCYAKAKLYLQDKRKYIGTLGASATKFVELIKGDTIPTLTVCLRRNLLLRYYKEIEPESKNWLMGDYPEWLWFAHNSKISFINKVVAVYRILRESMSHSQNVERRKAFSISSMEVQRFFVNLYSTNYSTNALNINFNDIERLILAKLAMEEGKYNLYKENIKMIQQKTWKICIRKAAGKNYLFFIILRFCLLMTNKIIK